MARHTQAAEALPVARALGRARARGRVTLFSVRFRSEMSDADLARLGRAFDLATHMQTKPGVGPISPGVVRLDFYSGLFLLRGAVEDEWVLEGRTWGDPARSTVHDWHIRAALAAREFDADVEPPPRLVVAPPDFPTRPPGPRGEQSAGPSRARPSAP